MEIKDFCKMCSNKIEVMTMLKKYNDFYCGVCGFKSKEDVKDMIVKASKPEEKKSKK